jgi:hypothetical protein
MKMFLLWAVIFAISFLVPSNVAVGFMLGSFFGIFWMFWYYA